MSSPDDEILEGEDSFDPPMVDSIYLDESRRGFAITFVPSDDASSAMTEFVLIGETSPDYGRVLTFWNRIDKLLATGAPVERITHGGGGAYTVHFSDQSACELSSISDVSKIDEVTDRLKQIADAAQIAFLDRTYARPVPKSA